MSEAWHQHLANLSWWEEIDRLFFPGKYSCSTFNPLDNVITVFWTVFFGICAIVVLHYVWRKHVGKKVTAEYIGDEPENKEIY